MLFAILFSACVNLARGLRSAPPEYFYIDQTASDMFEKDGCTVTEWKGVDPAALVGHPSMRAIDCPEGETFKDQGIVGTQHLRWYVRSGELHINEHKLSDPGDSYWAIQGAFVSFNLTGFSWIVGGDYVLTNKEYTFSSHFLGTKTRAYLVNDAILRKNPYAKMDADIRVNNGSLNGEWNHALDLHWTSISGIDPPNVMVMSCTPGTPYVWYHTHPNGAVYIPFTGKVCFHTNKKRCIVPGEARWTSPMLYYYETLAYIKTENKAAKKVAKAAGLDCDYPILFTATNFDSASISEQPNFEQIPPNAKEHPWWGYFERVTVRHTTVLYSAVQLDKNYLDLAGSITQALPSAGEPPLSMEEDAEALDVCMLGTAECEQETAANRAHL